LVAKRKWSKEKQVARGKVPMRHQFAELKIADSSFVALTPQTYAIFHAQLTGRIMELFQGDTLPCP
jgi:hypothetical protein